MRHTKATANCELPTGPDAHRHAEITKGIPMRVLLQAQREALAGAAGYDEFRHFHAVDFAAPLPERRGELVHGRPLRTLARHIATLLESRIMTIEGLGGARRGLAANLVLPPTRTRRVFFSFHYQRDISRAQQVKNHWVTKGSHESAGFFDGSLEEKAKTAGETAVKRLIDSGMHNSSVTCVLIGAETFTRRWVWYEIFRSVALGRGVFGVRVHNMKNLQRISDTQGTNPFWVLGYGTKAGNSRLRPMVRRRNGWADFPLADSVQASAAKYLSSGRCPVLSEIFTVYDWVNDNGFNSFSAWVDSAARQAGR